MKLFIAVVAVVSFALFIGHVSAEVDLLKSVWPEILTKMAYASDNIGHDKTEQLIGMLPGLDREIDRGDLDAVYATLAVIEPLEQQIFPHVKDPKIKAEFTKVTGQLVPVMAEMKKTGSIAPLQKFIHTAQPGMAEAVGSQPKS